MANKLVKIDKPKTIGVDASQDIIVLSKDIFPSDVNAGMIDNFIEQNFPSLINRSENQVNGVSVTKDEILITLSHPISTNQINQLISLLEDASW